MNVTIQEADGFFNINTTITEGSGHIDVEIIVSLLDTLIVRDEHIGLLMNKGEYLTSDKHMNDRYKAVLRASEKISDILRSLLREAE